MYLRIGNDMDKNVKIKWVYTPIIVVVSLIVGCALWLTCRSNVCNYLLERKSYFMSLLVNLLPKLVLIIFLFIVFKILSNVLLDFLFKKIFIKLSSDDSGYGLIKVFRFLLWSLYVLLVLSIIFENLSGLLASIGLVGFGLTFALQRPIANFVGWLTILLNGVYKEGDRIQVGSIRGDVKEIRVMNTVLQNLMSGSDVKDRKIVTFPNEYVLTSEVKNYTKDENYVLDELTIDITYESNYKKAMVLLEDIIKKQITKNKKDYLKKVKKQQELINDYIKKLLSVASKKEDKKLLKEAVMLTESKQELKEHMDYLRELEEEFKPKILVELSESSIKLIAHFLTPYDKIKQYRTDINLAFLDAVSAEPDIEIAYPHLQIITK